MFLFSRNLEHGPHLFCLSSIFCPLAFAWQMSYFWGSESKPIGNARAHKKGGGKKEFLYRRYREREKREKDG